NANINIGGPCTMSGADPMCGTSAKAVCNDEANDGFPGGYCSAEGCTASSFCPIGSSCAQLGGESDTCYKICRTDADCRMGVPGREEPLHLGHLAEGLLLP